MAPAPAPRDAIGMSPLPPTGRHARLPTDVPGIEALVALALDVRWSWNHAADALWKRLDASTWELTHSPWTALQTVGRDHLVKLLAEPEFAAQVHSLLQQRRAAAQAPAWFQQQHPASALTGVAYFSMEFMLSEALPIYSGGLGNVAGDLLKAAGDLGVPMTGIGLLYSQGYFRQVIDQDGRQQAIFPYNDPGQLPVIPLRRDNGEWLRFQLDLPGHPMWLRTWQVQVGRLKLYLLDSNDPANYAPYRGVTGSLYGGGPELRLQQELVLGLGGWRLLQLLGCEPELCHLNEGHAAFAVLERAGCLMQQQAVPFDAALAATRAGNLFTTHTAVAAGFDRFEPELIEHYLGRYAQQKLGIDARTLLGLGRADADDAHEPFSMAYLAMRGSGAANGVSRLHGQVSRRIFAPLYARWPLAEVPVGHITNGVHVPSWDGPEADALWTQACGTGYWSQPAPDAERALQRVSDATLWRARGSARAGLVDYARERLAAQLAASGAAAEAVAAARTLDPEVLTLGFARRFTSYKRPFLLLHDPERLLRLLTHPQRPIQLIIAGKAHPADVAGQVIITQWAQFIRRTGARARAMFLADADMLLTERLVQGVDVWLNTPRRPWEASGTSGMKVLVNGGLNLSELDGWWAEAYSQQVGWALGDGCEHSEEAAWDAAEAEALYRLLEQQIVPQFYERDPDGIPRAWTERMRHSMAQLTPQYSSARMVRDYVEQHYLPAAARYRSRAADQVRRGRQIAAWQAQLQTHWSGLTLTGLRVRSTADRHQFDIEVALGPLAAQHLAVELYAEALPGQRPAECHAMQGAAQRSAAGDYRYQVEVPATRPAAHYTVRAVPRYPGVSVPLEASQILWQR
jgi:starch phosphorylase